MIDMNSTESNEEEEPVAFYKELDIFGLEKPKSNIEQEQENYWQIKNEGIPRTFIPGASYSEYQTVRNFCLLNILSLGLYQLFWFYKHWNFIRENKDSNILPVWRSLLTLFFGYPLFRKFYRLAVEKGFNRKTPIGLIFILYIALTLAGELSEYLWILPLFSFIPLIPILNMMNFYYLKEQVAYNIRRKLSKGEKEFLYIFWAIILFLIFLIWSGPR